MFVEVLDVNDNFPKFTRRLYERKLVENVAVATVVQVVRANDADVGKNGNVRYMISAGNKAGNFSYHCESRVKFLLQNERIMPKLILLTSYRNCSMQDNGFNLQS